MKVTALVAAVSMALAGALAGCGQEGTGGASGGSSATGSSGSSGAGGSMGKSPSSPSGQQDPAKRSTSPASK